MRGNDIVGMVMMEGEGMTMMMMDGGIQVSGTRERVILSPGIAMTARGVSLRRYFCIIRHT